MPATNTQSSARHAVYYHRYRWIQLCAGVVLLVIAVFRLWDASDIIGVLFLLNAMFLLSVGHVLRIIVSPLGISYHNCGLYTISAPWTSIERVDYVPFRGAGSTPAIILREPAVQGCTAVAWMLPEQDRGRIIPLTVDWGHRDQLIRDIQQYAPHVRIKL